MKKLSFILILCCFLESTFADSSQNAKKITQDSKKDSNFNIKKAPYIPTLKTPVPLDSVESKEDSADIESANSPKTQNDEITPKNSKDSKSIESKNTESTKEDSIDIRNKRDDFHLNNANNTQDVEINKKETSGDDSLEIKENSPDEQKDMTLKHESLIVKKPKLNPLFSELRIRIGGGYHSLLALGDTQTLIFNAGFVNADVPLKVKYFILNVYGGATFGKVDTTSQNTSETTTYFSAMGGVALSIPFTKEYVEAHGVFGTEYGIGIRGSAINEINGFAGVDFVYNDFIFRPYLGLDSYFFNMESLKQGISGGMLGYAGFRTYYKYKQMRGYASVAVWQDFLRPSGGVFVLLPINNNAMYLGGNATSFDFEFGVEMQASKHFVIKGIANALYTFSYYNVNASIKVMGSFRF